MMFEVKTDCPYPNNFNLHKTSLNTLSLIENTAVMGVT